MFQGQWEGKQVFIRIPATLKPYSIRINGFRLGSDPSSGIASEFNITPFLKEKANTLDLDPGLPAKGSENILPDSPVAATLLIRDALHARDLVMTRHPGNEENIILVRFNIFLKSYQKERTMGHTIHLRVTDPYGRTVLLESREMNSPLSFGQETELILDLPLEDPWLWLPDSPRFYQLEFRSKLVPQCLFQHFGRYRIPGEIPHRH